MHQPLHVKVNEKQRFVCLGNILHHKSVRAKVPSYFKDQSVPIISYPYTSRIALTIFKHRRLLQDFSIDYITAKPPDCSCHHSPFKCSGWGALNTTLCETVCWWFSPGTPPISSTNKTDHHDITEILLKVMLNTININLHSNIIQMDTTLREIWRS